MKLYQSEERANRILNPVDSIYFAILVVLTIGAVFGDSVVFVLLYLPTYIIYMYLCRNKPDSSKVCVIALGESEFNYKELNGNYQVQIGYDRVKYVNYVERLGQSCISIGIDEQSELKCSNIDSEKDLMRELKVRAKL